MPAGKLVLMKRGKKPVKVAKVKPSPTPYYLSRRGRNNFTRAVRNVISRQAETKFIVDPFQSYNIQSGAPTSAFALNVIPNIAQGSDSHQREGEKLTAMYLKIKGIVRYRSDNLLNQFVNIYVIESKRNRNGNARLDSDVQILRTNNGQTALTGTHENSLLPIDTDYFRVVKRLKLKLGPFVSTGVGSYSDQTTPAWRAFSITVPIKYRTLVYPVNNAAACQPENCNMYLVANTVNVNNQLFGEAFTAEMTYRSQFYYKDF